MRRLVLVASIAGTLLAVAGAADAGTALAAKQNVLVLSRANNGSEGSTLANELRSLGYTVTLTSTLPTEKLKSYSALWSILAYEGVSFTEQEELEQYVREGGRLYLTGERPCCEELDLADQEIARAVLKNQSIVVGQQGDIFGEMTFNPQAEDSITKSPNVLGEFLADAPGGIVGIGGIESRNVLASNGTTALGAVFDEHEMTSGKGRLVIYMDIDWLASSFVGGGGEEGGGEPEARRHGGRSTRASGAADTRRLSRRSAAELATNRDEVIENIQDFLEKTPTRVGPLSAEYVALGDSYASGLGSSEYLPGTTGKKGCYKATHGYAETISEIFGFSLSFAACSGSTIGNLWEGKDAQLKNVGQGTSVVTLSIGGNDVGFSSVLKSCIGGFYSQGGGKGCATKDAAAAEEALGWLRYGRAPGTYKLPGGHGSTTNKQPLPSLRELYEAIAAQAPYSQLIVVGYPLLFETATETWNNCQVGTALGVDKLTIAASDIEWIDEQDNLVDETIEEAVNAARADTGADIVFADPRVQFYSHTLCDTEKSFINALDFEGLLPPHPKMESFHPTKEGQEAQREAIEAVAFF